jgi:excisionase family DNA binding protein
MAGPDPGRRAVAATGETSGGASAGYPVTLDLGGIVDGLREQLRAELRVAVRAEVEAAAWPEWMAIETAARYLDVTVERVRKLHARREIPFYQEGKGCRVFFRRSELDEWMARSRIAPRRRDSWRAA